MEGHPSVLTKRETWFSLSIGASFSAAATALAATLLACVPDRCLESSVAGDKERDEVSIVDKK